MQQNNLLVFGLRHIRRHFLEDLFGSENKTRSLFRIFLELNLFLLKVDEVFKFLDDFRNNRSLAVH